TTFAAVLEAGQSFAFPAVPLEGVSQTLLIQYLAVGGQLAGEDGQPLLDEGPLLTVLSFYEEAVAAGLISPALLDYKTPLDYWDDFLSGGLGLAVVDSTTYLGSLGQVPNVAAAPTWTASGDSLTTLDGWVWVLTTADPDRQAQAAVFLAWMMQSDRQQEFTQSFGMLPSRSGEDGAYAQLVETLLSGEQLIVADEVNAAVATALQTALMAVISGEESAEAATAQALAAFQ
ncbi:MAG: hypothetical protein JW910_13660, partial [Anaerolineae bacterium]|nr:hypothetical protein [Anaerolineae bacterium]